jgi:hypothetical protein
MKRTRYKYWLEVTCGEIVLLKDQVYEFDYKRCGILTQSSIMPHVTSVVLL